MLSEIRFKNFKCYEDYCFKLSSLNVLAGLNGMGKSTMLQGLLALKQSYSDMETIIGLHLNGDYVDLGHGKDVLFENSEDDTQVGISLVEDNREYSYSFEYNASSKILKSIGIKQKEEICKAISSEQFIYLSAERIIPRASYDLGNPIDVDNRRFHRTGEYIIQYLDRHGSERFGGSGDSVLNIEINKWMQEITPGVSPVTLVNQDLLYADLRFEFREGNEKTRPYRALNVGFGLTYVLPVVTALLTAQEGDYIIIENPEAHIHPRGQRKLGELISLAASKGAQVIVETHSDHLMNGIRLSVKKRKIDKNKVNFMYFYKDETTYEHLCMYPRIDENGRFDHWPKGFFDEWDESILELV